MFLKWFHTYFMSMSSVVFSDFIHLTAILRYSKITVGVGRILWHHCLWLCDIPFLSQNEPLSLDHQCSTFNVQCLEPSGLPPFLSIDKNKPVCSELCLRCGLWSFCPWLPVCGHHVEWHNSQPLFDYIIFSPTPHSSLQCSRLVRHHIQVLPGEDAAPCLFTP